MPDPDPTPAVQESPAVPAAPTGPSLAALAALDRSTPLTAADLARFLGRCPKSIHRAARRGELPAPFRLLGRLCWTAGAVLEHFGQRQGEALKQGARRDARIRALAP